MTVPRCAFGERVREVSSAGQAREGVSLDAQADCITRYCDAHGPRLGRIYVDAGVSGGIPLARRPEGAELLAGINGRAIAAVGALKLD